MAVLSGLPLLSFATDPAHSAKAASRPLSDCAAKLTVGASIPAVARSKIAAQMILFLFIFEISLNENNIIPLPILYIGHNISIIDIDIYETNIFFVSNFPLKLPYLNLSTRPGYSCRSSLPKAGVLFLQLETSRRSAA